MNEVIAVTGATGNVGRAVVEHLGAAGIVPRVLSRAADATWNAPVERITGDLADRATCERLFAGASRVFLMSFIERDPAVDRGVLDALVASGVRHVVKLSTIGVRSGSGIGLAHQARERDIEAAAAGAGLTWTFVRPGFFMTNVLQWRSQLSAGNALAVPAADGPTAPISPRDIAEVAALALRTPAAHAGKVYEVTGAELITPREQIAALGRALGRPLACSAVSPEVAAAAARASGMPAVIADTLEKLWTAQAAGNTAFRTTTFAELTGHPPETFEAWAQAFAPTAFAPPSS